MRENDQRASSPFRPWISGLGRALPAYINGLIYSSREMFSKCVCVSLTSLTSCQLISRCLIKGHLGVCVKEHSDWLGSLNCDLSVFSLADSDLVTRKLRDYEIGILE